MRRALLAAPLALLLLGLLVRTPARGEEPAPPAIGDQVGALRFGDIRYLPRSIDELGPSEATVLYFASVDCPLVRRYLPRLVALEAEFRGRDVRFVVVNEGPEDSVVRIAAQALELNAGFPFVKDWDGQVARAVGVDRTCHAVILDRDYRLRFRGRIDGQYRFGGVRPTVGRQDLREALLDVLAGRPVRVAETPVDGCKITVPEGDPPSGPPPTFAADVAPILYRRCVSCHRPGTEAPFSLLDYETAAANSEMIAEVVAQGRMPPWYASPDHGTFANERTLTAAERETIVAWAEADAPPGDLAKLPPAPELPPAGWANGEPDTVLTSPREIELPAEGYVPYEYVLLPHVFVDDTWVTGVEIRPSDRTVVHHANLAYVNVGEGFSKSTFITGIVPGGSPMKLPPGQGFRIPQGSMLVLQIHYVTIGKPARDRISVGLQYPRWTIRKQIHHVRAQDTRLRVPAGAPFHELRASATIPHDADLLALFGHMHLRGRDMTFVAHAPGKPPETLLVIPNYNFDWQLAYLLAPGTKRLPKGTRLEVIGHMDNSTFNPYNPDPSKEVRWGEQTYHEMFIGFAFYTDANEHLDVRCDPRTGMVVLDDDGPAAEEPPEPEAPSETPEPPAEPGRRYF